VSLVTVTRTEDRTLHQPGSVEFEAWGRLIATDASGCDVSQQQRSGQCREDLGEI